MSPPAIRERSRHGFRTLHAFLVFASLTAVAAADSADNSHEALADCALEPVLEHVREQFAQYGPKSINREYFGFVYSLDGKVASAVVRSYRCRSGDGCITNTAGAARAIPKGARVLGEWHTHPVRNGSRSLSMLDVHGARKNRHIPCYRAYYSTPLGEIYSWDTGQLTVHGAMATRARLGNFFDTPVLNDEVRMARVRR